MTLWDKYKGKEVTWDAIFEDDFLPIVKQRHARGESRQEALCAAMMDIQCRIPFGDVAPLSFMSKAREALGWT